jgi:8-oxo-dGTP diphosphatase
MKIKKIHCAGAIFLDEDGKILLEDRRKISKHGEEYSFFGGTVEDGESYEEALRREIKEELNYDFDDFEKFGIYETEFKRMTLIYHMYLLEMPPLPTVTPHEGADLKLCTIEQALQLKMTDIDKEILKDLQKKLPTFMS